MSLLTLKSGRAASGIGAWVPRPFVSVTRCTYTHIAHMRAICHSLLRDIWILYSWQKRGEIIYQAPVLCQEPCQLNLLTFSNLSLTQLTWLDPSLNRIWETWPENKLTMDLRLHQHPRKENYFHPKDADW